MPIRTPSARAKDDEESQSNLYSKKDILNRTFDFNDEMKKSFKADQKKIDTSLVTEKLCSFVTKKEKDNYIDFRELLNNEKKVKLTDIDNIINHLTENRRRFPESVSGVDIFKKACEIFVGPFWQFVR
jgi:hypothetical protein